MPSGQFGLVVKRIHLADAAVHEELQNPCYLRASVKTPILFDAGRICQQPVVSEQVRKSKTTQSAAQL